MKKMKFEIGDLVQHKIRPWTGRIAGFGQASKMVLVDGEVKWWTFKNEIRRVNEPGRTKAH